MGNEKVAKLKGRENYDTWKTYMEWYLTLKGLWPCVEGTGTDTGKNATAVATMGLLVESHVMSYVRGKRTAKEAWKALEDAFEDNGVLRRMDLLRHLMRLELCNCASMEEYVSQICETQQKLHKAKMEIPDDIVAQIMLSGLPDDYRPMVLAIANSGKALSVDLVRTNLLQEFDTRQRTVKHRHW